MAGGENVQFAAGPGPLPEQQSQPESSKVRTEFPETWLWSDVVAG